MRSLYSAASMDSGSYYPNETNMIVLGQSISYSLSQQSSPYSADFQVCKISLLRLKKIYVVMISSNAFVKVNQTLLFNTQYMIFSYIISTLKMEYLS